MDEARCLTHGMTNPLAALSKAEQLACRVAENVTGAVAIPWDIGGRQNAVDAFLNYADGRRAAFEVTRAGTDQAALQLDNLLGREGFEWPLPGAWWWDITITDVRDLPRLRQCYRKIILMCEAINAPRPELVRTPSWNVDEDLHWLLVESSVTFWGHPDVPSRDTFRTRKALVTSGGDGGVVDEALTGLRQALVEAFQVGNLHRHVEKVSRTAADEHHLFVILHENDLDFSVMSALMFDRSLPPNPAWLPAGLSHLWLAPAFSSRVLLSAGGVWSQAFPYVAIDSQGS